MKILAFDTSTEALSAAVQNGSQIWQHSGAGGALSSASLIPALQALMQQAGLAFAQLDAIAFGSGPGSFTGLRTACSVAQGLGFGAGVKLLPVPTLLAVAELARHAHGAQQVVAAMDARMGELYAACYDFSSALRNLDTPYQLVSPENLQVPEGFVLAGNGHAAYAQRMAYSGPSYAVLPTAAALLRLCPALLAAGLAVHAEDALPLYVRDKVAKTTAEREAEKHALANAAANPAAQAAAHVVALPGAGVVA